MQRFKSFVLNFWTVIAIEVAALVFSLYAYTSGGSHVYPKIEDTYVYGITPVMILAIGFASFVSRYHTGKWGVYGYIIAWTTAAIWLSMAVFNLTSTIEPIFTWQEDVVVALVFMQWVTTALYVLRAVNIARTQTAEEKQALADDADVIE